jgi:vacuolar-type H+-ATPase subunit F/Vma7
MLSAVAFVGDEISAAAYRLCGVRVSVADRTNASSQVKKACEQSSLVLLGSNVVQYLAVTEREALLANVAPPVLVVPDITGKEKVPEMATLVHKQLGMLE